MSFFLTFLLGC